MPQLTHANFSAFLQRFQENYLYYTSAYLGLYPELFIDQFVKNQVHVTRRVLGNPYAQQLQALASELSGRCFPIEGYHRRVYLCPELSQYKFSNN